LGFSRDALRQRAIVVPVEFWSRACVNCVRTLPHLVRWHEKYASQGLVVSGVHAPEFAFEREPAKLQAALRRHGIRYPVAQETRLRGGIGAWSSWFDKGSLRLEPKGRTASTAPKGKVQQRNIALRGCLALRAMT
jgi:hypothetical protein